MKINSITNYPKFKSITEEYRQPPAENSPVPEQLSFPKPKNVAVEKTELNPVALTGWTGAGALGIAIMTGLAKMPVVHKISSVVAALSIAAHIGVISANHKNYHKNDIVA